MRFDGFDDIERDEEPRAPVPLDAAESTWDPVLWALYLHALAEEVPRTLH